jgi:hypothetical protein
VRVRVLLALPNMIEYPSIINSSKAPRKDCIAFDKIDGSNIRIKYTPKQGFCLFGTRTQLIGENDNTLWVKALHIFKEKYEQVLLDKFKKNKDYRDFREITVFGEFHGPNSFAGIHSEADLDKLDITFFDVLLGHKQRKFVHPKTFVKDFSGIIPIPNIIYEGKLNDEFIADVRANKFNLNEGVICKGTETSGAFCGNIWMCKIKTQDYFDRLKAKQLDLNTYGE